MANLTIAVDDSVLKQARIQALQEGTSVNALLRTYLENYTNLKKQYRNAAANILSIAEQSTASSEGKRWTRDELYER